VPWVATKPVDSRYIDLSATSDYLVINRSNVIGSVADVYRLDTMARVWGVSSTSGLVFACGPSVCVNDGESIAAHDAATGAVRWKLGGALGLWDAGGGRLVLADGGYEGRRWLLDTAGHQIGPMIDGSLVVTAHPGGSVLLLRTTLDPDRTAVSRWNLGTGRLDLLGAVDGVGDRCDSVAHYLTCVHGDRFDVAAVA
jgi:outer membrane protein assembly factor BamB